MPTRSLVASPKGNGCGIALLRVDGGPTLAISVVPKLWPASGATVLRIDEGPGTAEPVVHLVVRELQTFTLVADSSVVLDSCIEALTNLRFEDDDTDQLLDASSSPKGPAPLFQEVPLSVVEESLTSDAADGGVQRLDVVDAFWSGVEEVGASSIVKTPENPQAEEPALLGQLLGSFPALEPVMRELFVSQAETALKRRMPDFRTATEELPFIRGSLTPRGLTRAVLGELDGLESTFAELDHDHPWQQVIRSAARQVVRRDLNQGIGAARIGRCRRIDRTLRDVTVPRTSELMRYRYDGRVLGKNRHASVAARLGVAILRRDNLGGHPVRTGGGVAVAAGLRIATSRLFEIMLAAGSDPVGDLRLVENSERLALLRNQQPTKRPDLLLVRSASSNAGTIATAEAVVDAKYKMVVPESPSKMDMGDQYQQFAYAATTGKRTVFVFAAPPSSSVRLSAWQAVNVPSLTSEVAVAAIPFPSPDGSWRPQLAASLGELIPLMNARPSVLSDEPA